VESAQGPNQFTPAQPQRDFCPLTRRPATLSPNENRRQSPPSRPASPTAPRYRLHRLWAALCCLVLFVLSQPQPAAAQTTAAKHLLIYAIDVEGGQSTLLVSLPAHPSWSTPAGPRQMAVTPPHPARHARRRNHQTRSCAHHSLPRRSRRRRPELVKRSHRRIPRSRPNREDSDITRHDYAAYLKAIEGKRAASSIPATPSPSPASTPSSSPPTATTSPQSQASRHPNPYCAAEPKWDLDQTENPARPAYSSPSANSVSSTWATSPRPRNSPRLPRQSHRHGRPLSRQPSRLQPVQFTSLRRCNPPR